MKIVYKRASKCFVLATPSFCLRCREHGYFHILLPILDMSARYVMKEENIMFSQVCTWSCQVIIIIPSGAQETRNKEVFRKTKNIHFSKSRKNGALLAFVDEGEGTEYSSIFPFFHRQTSLFFTELYVSNVCKIFFKERESEAIKCAYDDDDVKKRENASPFLPLSSVDEVGWEKWKSAFFPNKIMMGMMKNMGFIITWAASNTFMLPPFHCETSLKNYLPTRIMEKGIGSDFDGLFPPFIFSISSLWWW